MERPTQDELHSAEEADRKADQAAASSLAATVSKAHGVRAFPESAQRLLALLNAPTFEVGEVTTAIESDSSLAARVLRVINSPVFGARVRIRQIRVAVTLLGPRSLTEIALAAAVLDWFSDDSPAVPMIFRHSSTTAVLAKHLAKHLALSPEEMYTCGLLHDFGKLIMLQSGDESYAEMVAATMHEHEAIHHKERELYGYDHAVLGAHMLAEWNIPEPIPSVVSLHHRPDRAYRDSGQVGRMVAALRWAERLAHEFEVAAPIDEAWLDAMATDSAVRHLDLARGDLPTLCRDLERVFRENHNFLPLEAPAPAPEPEPAPAPEPEPEPALISEGPASDRVSRAPGRAAVLPLAIGTVSVLFVLAGASALLEAPVAWRYRALAWVAWSAHPAQSMFSVAAAIAAMGWVAQRLLTPRG